MIRVKLTLLMLQMLLHTNPSHQDEPVQSIEDFMPILTDIINNSLQKGKFPDKLKMQQ